MFLPHTSGKNYKEKSENNKHKIQSYGILGRWRCIIRDKNNSCFPPSTCSSSTIPYLQSHIWFVFLSLPQVINQQDPSTTYKTPQFFPSLSLYLVQASISLSLRTAQFIFHKAYKWSFQILRSIMSFKLSNGFPSHLGKNVISLSQSSEIHLICSLPL